MIKLEEAKLRVSEIFCSIQGEGSTMGKPSIFVRLQGCNLLCGNPQGSLKGKSQEEINQMQGDNATWTCDSIAVWLDGDKRKVTDIGDDIMAKYQTELEAGAQIIITGGEPLLQDDSIFHLIKYLKKPYPSLRTEIETNGTVTPLEYLYQPDYAPLVTQFNVSPKLANSGMSKERRIINKSMETFRILAYRKKAIFKFVVTRPEDLDEILKDYIHRFGLPKERIYLMPGCSNREQFEGVAPLVAKICQLEGFQFSSRLQINLWNQVTGV